MVKTFDILLDLEKELYSPSSLLFTVSRNDFNTIQLNFVITQDGTPLDLTNKTVELAVKKPSGLTVYQACEVTSPLEGKAQLDLNQQAYIEFGIYTAEVYIRDVNNLAVTSPFWYQSRTPIFNETTEEAVQSSNDWSALQELLFAYDLRPKIVEGVPTITPEYIGQMAFDSLNKITYIAGDLTPESWRTFGAVEGGGVISWAEILDKPTAFTPEIHTHDYIDIQNKPLTFPPEEHGHEIIEITGLQNALDLKADDTDLTTKANSADVYTKLETYNKTEVNDLVTGAEVVVEDNLISNSVDSALSANQGRILDETKADINHNHNDIYHAKNEPLMVDSGASVISADFINDNGEIVMLIHPTVNAFQSMDALKGAKPFKIEGFEGATLPLIELNGTLVNAIGKLQEGGVDIATIYAPIVHRHIWSDIDEKPTTFTPPLASTSTVGGHRVGNGLAMSGEYLLVKSGNGLRTDGTTTYQVEIDRAVTDTWYLAKTGGEITDTLIVNNKGDNKEQVRFNIDRAWSIKQIGIDASAQLALVADTDKKEFVILSPLGAKALTVRVDNLGGYIDSPEIRENGQKLIDKYVKAEQSNGLSIWKGSQAEYNAIATKSDSTIYIINPPIKPNLNIENRTNAVQLYWDIGNATSWTIWRSEVKNTLGEKLVSSLITNSYLDSTALGGTKYYYTLQVDDVDERTISDQVEASPYSITVYDAKRVDFAGYAGWTIYGSAQATADFGNEFTVQGGDRLKIDTGEKLRFYLPAGMVGSSDTGGIIKANIAGKSSYTIEYGIRFDGGFAWSKGGKVPGFSGGAGYTGGKPAWDGDGFSVRLMWREGGRIIPYVYHYNQPDEFGDTFGKTLGYFTDTTEHTVKYEAVLNTGSSANGILKIYLDGALVFEKYDLIYRTDESLIDTAHIAIFAGGSDASWNMTADSYIRLNYFSWQ